MDEGESLNFEKHRRQREENASVVRCVRCGRWIVATATRCPECGVHFQGEAQDFSHPSERPTGSGTPSWVVVVVILLLVALVVSVLGLR